MYVLDCNLWIRIEKIVLTPSIGAKNLVIKGVD